MVTLGLDLLPADIHHLLWIQGEQPTPYALCQLLARLAAALMLSQASRAL